MRDNLAYMIGGVLALAGIGLFVMGRPTAVGEDLATKRRNMKPIEQTFNQLTVSAAANYYTSVQKQVKESADSERDWVTNDVYAIDLANYSSPQGAATYRSATWPQRRVELARKLAAISVPAPRFNQVDGLLIKMSADELQRQINDVGFDGVNRKVEDAAAVADQRGQDAKKSAVLSVSCLQYLVETLIAATGGQNSKVLELVETNFASFDSATAIPTAQNENVSSDAFRYREFTVVLRVDADLIAPIVSEFARRATQPEFSAPRVILNGFSIQNRSIPNGARDNDTVNPSKAVEILKGVLRDVPDSDREYLQWENDPTTGWPNVHRMANKLGVGRPKLAATLELTLRHVSNNAKGTMAVLHHNMEK